MADGELPYIRISIEAPRVVFVLSNQVSSLRWCGCQHWEKGKDGTEAL